MATAVPRHRDDLMLAGGTDSPVTTAPAPPAHTLANGLAHMAAVQALHHVGKYLTRTLPRSDRRRRAEVLALPTWQRHTVIQSAEIDLDRILQEELVALEVIA